MPKRRLASKLHNAQATGFLSYEKANNTLNYSTFPLVIRNAVRDLLGLLGTTSIVELLMPRLPRSRLVCPRVLVSPSSNGSVLVSPSSNGSIIELDGKKGIL